MSADGRLHQESRQRRAGQFPVLIRTLGIPRHLVAYRGDNNGGDAPFRNGLACSSGILAGRCSGGHQTRHSPDHSTREDVCGSRATLLAIPSSAVCLRIDDFATSDQMGAREKSRPVRQRGRVVALFRQAAYAIAVSLAATMSAAAADWPLEPARTRPRTRYLVPRRSHNGRAKSVDAIGIASAERRRISSAPQACPFFPGSPTQICRHIPVEALVGWNTCLASSSRDLPAAAPSPAENLQRRRFSASTFPYSSTNSDQRDGRLAYATVDLGWTWRSEGIKLGFFAGYTFIISNA